MYTFFSAGRISTKWFTHFSRMQATLKVPLQADQAKVVPMHDEICLTLFWYKYAIYIVKFSEKSSKMQPQALQSYLLIAKITQKSNKCIHKTNILLMICNLGTEGSKIPYWTIDYQERRSINPKYSILFANHRQYQSCRYYKKITRIP